MRDNVARIWFGVTAVCVVTGVTISVVLAIGQARYVYEPGGLHSTGEYGSAWARALNVFTYFTILSNLIVAATCTLLAVKPRRFSKGFAVWRLAGLVAITITGLIYNLVLAQYIGEQSFASALSNDLEHRVVPVLAVLGWLFFGPRLPFRWQTIGGGLVIGLLWVTFTMVRGLFPVANQNDSYWYPYPFLDAANLGYAQVSLNLLGVLAIFMVLSVGILLLDRVLPGPRPAQQVHPEQVAGTGSVSPTSG